VLGIWCGLCGTARKLSFRMLREREQGNKICQFCMVLVWVLPCSFYQRHAYRSRDFSLLIMLIGCGWKLKINEVRATPLLMPHGGEFPLPEAERSGNEDLRRLLLEVPKAQQLSVFRLRICRTHFGVSELADCPYFSFPDCQSMHGESSVLSKSKWC